MSQHDINSTSNVFVLASHFYSILRHGKEGVETWMENKGVDIFKLKLIFIPICEELHWSLAVIVNPGAIMNGHRKKRRETQLHGCMLFFDSLKSHHDMKTIHNNLLAWLNAEWLRRGNTPAKPFTANIFPVYNPKGEYCMLSL